MIFIHRKASQIAALTGTAAGSDNEGPNEPQPSALPVDSESDKKYEAQPAKTQLPAGRVILDLLELVICNMGRKELFSKDTLKNIRQTSRAFKLLIDGLFSSLFSKVTIHENKSFEDLSRCPFIIQTMETFRYVGARTLKVSSAAALMAANPLQLKKLELRKPGLAFDIIVQCSLPNLTSLEISGLTKKSKALVWLCSAENVWRLQELRLSSGSLEHAVLVPALKRLRQLRKLTLGGTVLSSSGRLNPEGFVGDCFPELETLELLYVHAPNRLGLLSHASLPALRHLTVRCSGRCDTTVAYLGLYFLTSLDAPWLQHLQSLDFNSQYRRGLFSGDASFLTAFHSGALKTLVIENWHQEHALFDSVHLLGLTSLELCLRYPYYKEIPIRVMTPLATASLPLLSKLTILGEDYTLAEGDFNLLSAFTQLRSLSMFSLGVKESDWAWFVGSNVLSRLEEFATSCEEFITSISALDLSTAAWPLMRKLSFRSHHLVDILSLAPRFPRVTALEVDNVSSIRGRKNGLQPGQAAAYEVILSAAVNERAWPDLESLSFKLWGRYDGYGIDADITVLARAWPRATIQGRWYLAWVTILPK